MFKLQVKLGNDAFCEPGNVELARILRAAAAQLEQGHMRHTLRDINGNRVGEWTLK